VDAFCWLKVQQSLYKITPEVGLEPTTLRLRFTLSFRQGADYLINFSNCKSCRALVGSYWLGSSIPSLCTFLPTLFSQTIQQASLKVAILFITREGFLEFTQFFNHSHLWKLQLTLQPDALPLSYSGKILHMKERLP
jgi:hypothetical protein